MPKDRSRPGCRLRQRLPLLPSLPALSARRPRPAAAGPAGRAAAAFVAAIAGAMVLLAAAAPASASWTRIASLGGDADYFEDARNVLAWYGSLPSYGNVAALELGTAGEAARTAGPTPWDAGLAAGRGAGVHADLDARGAWGTVALYLFPEEPGDDRPGNWAVLYGRRLAGGQVGLLFGQRWGEFGASDPQDHHESISDLTVGLGARWDLGERAYLDLAGAWSGADREYFDAAADVHQHERSWGSFDLRARLFVRLRETVVLVPVGEYRRDDRLEDAGSGQPFAPLDAWRTRLGLGLNLLPDEDVLGLFSIEWRRGRTRLSPAAEWLGDAQGGRYDLAIARLGLEARVRPWLSLRAGAVSANHARGGDDLLALAGLGRQFDLTIGLGLHLGRLDADLLLADETLFDLGGAAGETGGADGEEDPAFTSVSLAYSF